MARHKNRQQGFGVIESVILVFILLVAGVSVLLAYSSAKAKARDAQRVSDIIQLQKALKYYHEEFGQYPQASNYIAVGVDNSFSRFVSKWPTAPKADGNCTAEYNNYAYDQINDGEGYQLRFCLGQAYGNLNAGVRIATPDGYQ